MVWYSSSSILVASFLIGSFVRIHVSSQNTSKLKNKHPEQHAQKVDIPPWVGAGIRKLIILASLPVS